MESLEGQLNHALFVIALVHRFLTRMRALKNSGSNKQSWLHAKDEVLATFVLWCSLLLVKAHASITI